MAQSLGAIMCHLLSSTEFIIASQNRRCLGWESEKTAKKKKEEKKEATKDDSVYPAALAV
jgi:hypothetical protein